MKEKLHLVKNRALWHVVGWGTSNCVSGKGFVDNEWIQSLGQSRNYSLLGTLQEYNNLDSA